MLGAFPAPAGTKDLLLEDWVGMTSKCSLGKEFSVAQKRRSRLEKTKKQHFLFGAGGTGHSSHCALLRGARVILPSVHGPHCPSMDLSWLLPSIPGLAVPFHSGVHCPKPLALVPR